MQREEGFKVIYLEKKGIKQNKRKEDVKAGKQRIISSQGHRTERSTSLSHFCQLTSFFHSSFWLCLSDSFIPSDSPLFSFSVCVFVHVCQRVTWSVIRVSGTELSHIDRARPQDSLSHVKSTVDLAGHQTEPSMGSLDMAIALKGQITMLHHICSSL